VAAPLAPAAQAAKVSPVNAGARPKPRAAEAFPSWGGLAEPVASADNLKEIVGIGQVIEARLRGLGVTSFRQLATMGDTDVERLVALLEGFGTRIISDDWVGQARELEVRYHGGL
jgi:predicted flap endonuclease-1-like 5' DNA nuclease